MSWWPFSSQARPAPESSIAEHTNTQTSQPEIAVPSEQPTKPIDKSEAEISQLLYGFTEAAPKSSTNPQDRQTSDSSSPSQSKIKTFQRPTSIAPYPEEMSCRQAFDNAWYCQSPGGQFMNVYRFGSARDCSQNWSQFWFCMRNRGRPENMKREAIREWYMKHEEKYARGPSSEDVWTERTVPLERAFDWDPDAVVAEGADAPSDVKS